MGERPGVDFSRVYVVSGSIHEQLAKDTVQTMGTELGPVERRRFPDGEIYVRYEDSVRGRHVIVQQSQVQTEGWTVNDALFEHLLLIEAARTSSAREITAVLPYAAYARQDRKARGREPVSAAMLMRILASVEVDRIVTIDIHSPQTLGVFSRQTDNLTAQPLLREAVRRQMPEDAGDKYVVIAPDSGSVKLADRHRAKLDLGMVLMTKIRNRERPGELTHDPEIPGVEGKVCLVFDDMIASGGTLRSAAFALYEAGAKGIIVAATHGLFSGDALKRLDDSPIDQIIVTDTVPTGRAAEQLGEKLQVVSVAPLIGAALHEILTDGSVSSLFEGDEHHK